MKRLFVFAFPLVCLAGSHASAAAAVECDASRPAVAYRSDGTTVSPSSAPIPCAGTTGYGGFETRIVVAPNGDVAVLPAVTDVPPPPLGSGLESGVITNATGLALSPDQGGSWPLVKPDGKFIQHADHALHFDRATGRLFLFAIFGGGHTALNVSPMQGEILTSPGSPYTDWESTITPGYIPENPRFTTAPAPAGQRQPAPGESVAYWCGNLGLGRQVRTCHRSFDGGATWEFASIVQSTPVPQHGECEGNAERTGAGEGQGYPQGDPTDGSLWVLIECNEKVFLSRSADEATTWPIVTEIPFSSPDSRWEVRVDTAGNLYFAELDGSSLLLRISRDDGQTWSAPVNMTPPAARGTTIELWWLAIGYQPGQVAVSALTTREEGGFDGYIAVTHDAFDPNPVFFGQTLNPPGTPMLTDLGLPSHYVGVDFAPDGTPWAAFWSDCRADDPFCAKAQSQQGPRLFDGYFGTTVGRLSFPQSGAP